MRAIDRNEVSMRRIFDDSGDSIDQPASGSAKAATVSTIMTRTVYCVQPDVGLNLLAALFLQYNVSGLPVVDKDGRPIGVVSKTDVVRYVHEHGSELAGTLTEARQLLAELGAGFHAVEIDAVTVRELMMPIVFAVAHDAPIGKAAALMAGEGVHRLPVLDDEGTVCGILSPLDIVRWVAIGSGYPIR